MDIQIRKSTQNDMDTIYDLICALEAFTFPKNTFKNIFNLNSSNNNIGYFIAESEGQVVGFGSIYINNLLHHCGKIGEIQELVISPEQRGNKIGSLLVKEMIRWALKRGATQVEVTCNLARESAHAFYQSMGFVHTHKKFVYNCE